MSISASRHGLCVQRGITRISDHHFDHHLTHLLLRQKSAGINVSALIMESERSRLQNYRDIGKKILAVGRNYKSLARQQGNPIPDCPLVFMKATNSYITEGQKIKIPPLCKSLCYEAELGIVFGKTGKDIPENQAMDYVGGYILALDMTAWDMQQDAMKKGHPWTLSKSWDTACPVSEFIPKDQIPNPFNLQLWLKVNGETKQDGNTDDMIFKIPYLISFLSKYFTLEEGDVLLTGTPSGIGEVKPGDIIHAGLADIVDMTFAVDDLFD